MSYPQSHGEKCRKYHGILCAWLSEHPELHSRIPGTANLEGNLVRASPPSTLSVGEVVSLTTLTELQVELNTTLAEVQVAANRLADYATRRRWSNNANNGVGRISVPNIRRWYHQHIIDSSHHHVKALE